MFCKFCGKEIEDGIAVCPECGEYLGEKAKKKNVWKLVLICAAAVVLLAALAWVVYWGVTGGFTPKKNDISYKESYTVDADKALAKREQIVATMGEDNLTGGQLQVFYGMQIMEYLNYYYQGYEFNYLQPLDEQFYNEEAGLTWQHYFLEKALTAWKQYRTMKNQADEAGYELPQEYQDYFANLSTNLAGMAQEDGFSSVDEMLQKDLGGGCTYEDYRYYLELYYYGNLYFSDLAEEFEITTEELEAYFLKYQEDLELSGVTKNSGYLVDVRHILIQPAGMKNDGSQAEVTDLAWQECQQKAQQVYDEYLAGEQTEERFYDLAVKYSVDGNASTGGLYTYVYKGQMVKEFEDWCFDESRKPGDTGIVKTKFGYHIMYYVEGDEGWIRFCTEGVMEEKSKALLAEMTEGAELKTDYKKIVLGAANLSDDKK